MFRTEQDKQAYLGYADRSIHPQNLCVLNGAHHAISSRGAYGGYLMTFNKPTPTFRSVDLSAIQMGDSTLDQAIAAFAVESLLQEGLSLPMGTEKTAKESLLHYYMLRTSLCYVETRTRKGTERFFVTKSAEVLSALYPRLAPADKKKSFDRFEIPFSISYEELKNGTFEVVKVVPDVDGFRLSRSSIHIHNKAVVIPMYAVANYADAIANFLQQHRVKMVYIENGAAQKLITSLNRATVSKWLNTNHWHAEAVMAANWDNPMSFGSIMLPDLYRMHEFVHIPLLHIKSVTVCE